jgi:hypothetical protein
MGRSVIADVAVEAWWEARARMLATSESGFLVGQPASAGNPKDYVLAMVPAMQNPDGEITTDWLIDHAMQVRPHSSLFW